MKKIFVLLFALSICIGCKKQEENNDDTNSDIVQNEPKGIENIAYKWGEMALIATANDTERFNPRPTITSRYLGLIFTSIFDAWSRYDALATPVYLADVSRRPNNEHTLKKQRNCDKLCCF